MARAMGNKMTVISDKMADDDCKFCGGWSLKAFSPARPYSAHRPFPRLLPLKLSGLSFAYTTPAMTQFPHLYAVLLLVYIVHGETFSY